MFIPETYPSINRTKYSLPVIRLHLRKQPDIQKPLINGIATFVRVDKPILIKSVLRLIPGIGIGLFITGIFKRISDKNSRHIRQCFILLFIHLYKGDSVRLRDIKRISFINITCIPQVHGKVLRQIYQCVFYFPVIEKPSVFTNIPHIINITGMYGITFSRMSKSNGKILVFGTLVMVHPPRPVIPIIEIKGRGRRDILRMQHP